MCAALCTVGDTKIHQSELRSNYSNFLEMPPLTVASIAHLLFNIGSVFLSLGLTGLGVLCMVSPGTAATLYGLPSDNIPWVQVAGLRDLGLGLASISLYLFCPSAMRFYTLAILPIPAGDAYLTHVSGGTIDGFLSHSFGIVAIGTLAACAWLDPALKSKID